MSAQSAPQHPAPETRLVTGRRFSCDGGEGALGHPRVWLTVPHDTGWIDCPYCDARFQMDPAHADDGH